MVEQDHSKIYERYIKKYRELWDEDPPPGYVERALERGLNLLEFEWHEKQKPAFRRTAAYAREYERYRKMIEEGNDADSGV